MAVVQERELYRICVHVGRYGSVMNNAITLDLKLTALQVVMREKFQQRNPPEEEQKQEYYEIHAKRLPKEI